MDSNVWLSSGTPSSTKISTATPQAQTSSISERQSLVVLVSTYRMATVGYSGLLSGDSNTRSGRFSFSTARRNFSQFFLVIAKSASSSQGRNPPWRMAPSTEPPSK